MDLDVLFWLLIAGIVLVWLSHEVPAPTEALGGIFGFREVLWPSGVQEDDDARWTWARALRERTAPPAPDAAETAERPDDRDRDWDWDRAWYDERPGSPPEVHGGRYEVRATVRPQVRSADRARS